MRIIIQNMVCRHCVQALNGVFEKLGIAVGDIGIGYADIDDTAMPQSLLPVFDRMLAEQGFVRVANADDCVVQNVKKAVQNHVRSESECRLKLSACIESHIGMPYEQASRIFSARQGRTIEKYAIAIRVEWVKELLSYGNLTVSEIAFRTGYSSAAHLSRQFKAVTGLTPTQFIEAGAPRRSIADV